MKEAGTAQTRVIFWRSLRRTFWAQTAVVTFYMPFGPQWRRTTTSRCPAERKNQPEQEQRASSFTT